MADLRIEFPHDGDILNRHDGTETDECLTISVRGTVPAGLRVTVNGFEAKHENEAFSCEA